MNALLNYPVVGSIYLWNLVYGAAKYKISYNTIYIEFCFCKHFWSGIVIEVIRGVISNFFFFYEKILQAQKA